MSGSFVSGQPSYPVVINLPLTIKLLDQICNVEYLMRDKELNLIYWVADPTTIINNNNNNNKTTK